MAVISRWLQSLEFSLIVWPEDKLVKEMWIGYISSFLIGGWVRVPPSWMIDRLDAASLFLMESGLYVVSLCVTVFHLRRVMWPEERLKVPGY